MATPETLLANKFKAFMEARGWYVMNTAGSKFQQGFPDKYCLHPKYGSRWVELKAKKRFTAYQLYWFPVFHFCKIGIWVFMEYNEQEYKKLFEPPNWISYVGKTQMGQIRKYYPNFPEN